MFISEIAGETLVVFILNLVCKHRSSILDFPIINMVGSPLVRGLPPCTEDSFNRIQPIAKRVMKNCPNAEV